MGDPSDFKSLAYTNSATRPHKNLEVPFCVSCQGAEQENASSLAIFLEVPTGIEPVYAVLQTAA